MAELFTKQAAEYAAAHPAYPKDLFTKLAALTAHHRLAWDVGTGNGQAAIGVAEHYDSVLATRSSCCVPHHTQRSGNLHTPDATPGEDDQVAALGGEGSVDLITVAEAVHWFDLPAFYAVARRACDRCLGQQLPRHTRGGHDGTLPQHHPALPGPPTRYSVLD
ncbi:hypothetical protein HU200_036389 [Digitaria exilis]|uniref:Methyltransferase type 11 domain-containing protein n=1 Tax=Digitaria exilis TaxID=1010633 RepID=A0A835BLM0_9POAL|nr:hypothetical protein HU200_036389 [Digitaria exilis]